MSSELEAKYKQTIRDFSGKISKHIQLLETTRETIEGTACMVAIVPKPLLKLIDFIGKECTRLHPYTDFDHLFQYCEGLTNKEYRRFVLSLGESVREYDRLSKSYKRIMPELIAAIQSDMALMRQEIDERKANADLSQLRRTVTNVISDLEDGKDNSFKLLEAAMAYESLRCANTLQEDPEIASYHQRAMVRFGSAILRLSKNEDWDSYVASIAAMIPQFELYRKNEDDFADTMLETYKDVAKRQLEFGHVSTIQELKILIIVRKYSKRLPKPLSDFCRTILDDRIHNDSSFWKGICDGDSIADRLTRHGIQSQALDVYGYDPTDSYVSELIGPLSHEVFWNSDPKSHYLLSHLLSSYKWKDIDARFLKLYGSRLSTLSYKARTDLDILYLSTAKEYLSALPTLQSESI